jgi:ribulose-bisphosphate carboxylase large chain
MAAVGEWLLVTYRVRSTPDQIDRRAQAIALEQSVEMPLEAVANDWVRDEIAGRVEEITSTDGGYRVVIGLSATTVGDNPAQR